MIEVDVAVVGAGPAGAVAAQTAAELGASVILIDEQDAAGGYLRWTLAPQHGLAGPIDGKRGFEIAAHLAGLVEHPNIDYRPTTVAWGLFEEHVLGIARDDSAEEVQAGAIILATGSTDIVWPFRGWDLPGVITARAARIYMHLYRVRPGHRAVVVGSGEDAGQLIEDFRMAGLEVVATVESPGGLEAGGDGEVQWVDVNGERLEADTVALALGALPDPDLARQAPAVIGYSELSGCHVPLRTATFETTASGIYVVGDAAGLCTTSEAWAEGEIAAGAAAGSEPSGDALERLAKARSEARSAEVERLRPVAATA